jgi:hypothetical protein
MWWNRISPFLRPGPLAVMVFGLALATVGMPAVMADDDGLHSCSNRTLHGDYGFRMDGTVFLPGPAPNVGLRGLALARFDGRGNRSGLDFVTINGMPESDDWRPTTGTYHVNADCTATQEILFEDGATVNLRMIIVDGGRQILTIAEGKPTGSIGFRIR